MKILKIIGIIIILLSHYQSNAQENNSNKTAEERARNQTLAISKACNLTIEQQQKVEKIILNTITKLSELRATKPTQRGEKLKEFQTIRDNQNVEIKQILTPEQYVKYQELIDNQKQKIRERQSENRREVIENNE